MKPKRALLSKNVLFFVLGLAITAAGCSSTQNERPGGANPVRNVAPSPGGQQLFTDALTKWHALQRNGITPADRDQVELLVMNDLRSAINSDRTCILYYTAFAQTRLVTDPSPKAIAEAEAMVNTAAALSSDFVPVYLLKAEIALTRRQFAEVDKQLAEAGKALARLNHLVDESKGMRSQPVRLLGIIPMGSADSPQALDARQQRAQTLIGYHFVDNSWSILGGSGFGKARQFSAIPSAEDVIQRLTARGQLVAMLAAVAKSPSPDPATAKQLVSGFDALHDLDKTYVPAELQRARFYASQGRTIEAIDMCTGLVRLPDADISRNPWVVQTLAELSTVLLESPGKTAPAQLGQISGQALAALDTLPEIPSSITTVKHYLRARIFFAMADLVGSKAFFDQAMQEFSACQRNDLPPLTDQQLKTLQSRQARLAGRFGK